MNNCMGESFITLAQNKKLQKKKKGQKITPEEGIRLCADEKRLLMH